MIQLCYDLILQDFDQIWKISSTQITLYTQVASRCIMKMSKTCDINTMYRCITELAKTKLNGNENERNAMLGIFLYFVLGSTGSKKDLSTLHSDISLISLKYTQDENPKARA